MELETTLRIIEIISKVEHPLIIGYLLGVLSCFIAFILLRKFKDSEYAVGSKQNLAELNLIIDNVRLENEQQKKIICELKNELEQLKIDFSILLTNKQDENTSG